MNILLVKPQHPMTNDKEQKLKASAQENELEDAYYICQQAKEIERLNQELDFAIKSRDKFKLAWEENSCIVANLSDEVDSLKLQLEAKAVDVEEIRQEFNRLLCSTEYILFESETVVHQYAINVWNFFLPHLQPGKSDAWIDANQEPEFGGEYNVLYDLQDEKEPLVTTMDFDKVNKLWMDTRGANIPIHTVLMWKSLPEPPKNFISNT